MDHAILGADGTIRCPKCGATGLSEERSGILSRRLLRCPACHGTFSGAKATPLANPPAPTLRGLFSRPAPAPPAGWPPSAPYGPPAGPPVAPGVHTLRLLRTTKSIPAVAAIVAVRPGMTHAQARALLAAAKVQPQELLVGLPRAEIEYAAAVLRRAGVAFDVA